MHNLQLYTDMQDTIIISTEDLKMCSHIYLK